MIMIVLSSQMTGRIVTYYIFLILLLPYIVDWCIRLFCYVGLDEVFKNVVGVFDTNAPVVVSKVVDVVPDTVWEQLPESIASFAIFSLVIPFCWNWVDEYLEDVAEESTLNRKET